MRWAPGFVASVALAVAFGSLMTAWGLQRSAAGDLERAGELQARETGDQDMEPPSTEENEVILETLEDAIGLRRDIDSILRRVEDALAFLTAKQSASRELSGRSGAELDRIARAVGGVLESARASTGRLGVLRGDLQVSAELAQRIAEELEELDENMGTGLILP